MGMIILREFVMTREKSLVVVNIRTYDNNVYKKKIDAVDL